MSDRACGGSTTYSPQGMRRIGRPSTNGANGSISGGATISRLSWLTADRQLLSSGQTVAGQQTDSRWQAHGSRGESASTEWAAIVCLEALEPKSGADSKRTVILSARVRRNVARAGCNRNVGLTGLIGHVCEQGVDFCFDHHLRSGL